MGRIETGSHSAAQAGLEITMYVSQTGLKFGANPPASASQAWGFQA